MACCGAIDQSSCTGNRDISATIVAVLLNQFSAGGGAYVARRCAGRQSWQHDWALRLAIRRKWLSRSRLMSSSNSNRRRVRVAGIFRSGLFEYDSTWIYLSLDTIAAFTGDAHAASVVSVQVADIYNVKQTSAQIKQKLGSAYAVIDWQEANRPLFTALTIERRIGIMIIALIVLIAALNITTTLILLVMERRRTLRSSVQWAPRQMASWRSS